MDSPTPKLKRALESDKVTLYFDKEVKELYKLGKANGWDTPEIVRKAASEELMRRQKDLLKKA